MAGLFRVQFFQLPGSDIVMKIQSSLGKRKTIRIPLIKFQPSQSEIFDIK